jgi:hypothetical protein
VRYDIKALDDALTVCGRKITLLLHLSANPNHDQVLRANFKTSGKVFRNTCLITISKHCWKTHFHADKCVNSVIIMAYTGEKSYET